MKKIPTVFERNPDDRKHLLPTPSPGCQWVLDGEGVATVKYDGNCLMFDGEQWFARREVKPDRTPPPNWVQVDADPVTGRRVGWEPVEQSSFAQAFAEVLFRPAQPQVGATYELIGPKVNGNPHCVQAHCLRRHGMDIIEDVPRDFEGLRAYMLAMPPPRTQGYEEGIVFWREIDNPAAGLAKLKVRDFA